MKYRATDKSALRETERFLEGTIAGMCGVTEEELTVQRGVIVYFVLCFDNKCNVLKSIHRKFEEFSGIEQEEEEESFKVLKLNTAKLC